MEKGRFTLPGEKGMEKQIIELIDKWGVDAVRDSDGTTLSDEIINMGLNIYSTLCLVREDNEWAKVNQQCLQQIYLTSKTIVAKTDTLKIDIMDDYFKQQFKPNIDIDVKKYWQVMDRTLNKPVALEKWNYNKETGMVELNNVKTWHQYSVSFLAYQIWEPVSMYNHITNDWQEEHKLPVDIRYPEAAAHTLEVLENWLIEHPKTDIVRFTTFFYNFDLIYNGIGKERQVDWFGYLSAVSPLALDQFEKAYGYRLTPEDFIDKGYFNTPFKNPSKEYLDWMDFNQKFIAEFARKCVKLVHEYNKKAIMFLGDHWAGTEPYGKHFQTIGLDAVVGAAGDGVTTRMIADIPVAETEARFYPYFFPDVFHEGGDPVGESTEIWKKCRRALMRKPMERMGYGGYLSLALKFPEFVSHVTDIATQFKAIHTKAQGTKPYVAPFKVAMLNSWGQIRSWQTHQVAHSLWHQRCYSYLGILEALAGLPFELEFISFDDIREKGISKEIGVIINAGDAGTSWSGGDNWADENIVTTIREWVYNGGGFIGIGEPTAHDYNGSFFQLSDILGVQKEIGLTGSHNKPKVTQSEPHFITEDVSGKINYGEGMTMIYRAVDTAKVLDVDKLSHNCVANTCEKGRGVYFAGMPYSNENTRLLTRAIFWAASKEADMKTYYSSNLNVECNAYKESGVCAVINNSVKVQTTTIFLENGEEIDLELKPMACEWIDIK